jgi:hypothetical protein
MYMIMTTYISDSIKIRPHDDMSAYILFLKG